MGNKLSYLENPLVKKINEDEAIGYEGNYFLYAGGGYGKTTAMQCLFKYLIDQATKGKKIVPVYIDIKQINFNKNNPIINYIYSTYSGKGTSEIDVERLFSNQALTFSKEYKYYILIDGYNESNEDAKPNINTDIRMLTAQRNVKLFVSSRINEQVDIFSDFKRFSLLGLNDKQIEIYLNHKFAKYNKNANSKIINKTLIEILRIPLFMDAFSKTYNEKSPYPDLYEEKTVRKADILDCFILHTLKKLKREENINDLLVEFVVMYFLPTIAFNMVKNGGFIIGDKDFTAIRDNVSYFEKLLSTEQQGIYLKNYILDKYDIEKICCNNITLLNRTSEGYTLHQIWRDFFAAKHIINCLNAEVLDELETSVDENVRQFVGELVREYDNNYKYSKSYKDEDNRRSECGFEEKDNSEKPYSPIEHFLQKNYLSLNKKPITIKYLIEIMKTCRNNRITACYDNLDLKNVMFYGDCTISKSSFNNSKVYIDNFPDEISGDIESLCFSTDNTTLAINTWSNIYLKNLVDHATHIIEKEPRTIDAGGYYSPGGQIRFSLNNNYLGVHGCEVESWDLYDAQAFNLISHSILDDINSVEEIDDLVFKNEVDEGEINALIKSINNSQENRVIIVNDSNTEVILKSVKNTVLLNDKYFLHEKYNINSIKLFNNNKSLLTGNSNGEINLYKINLNSLSSKLVKTINNGENVRCLAVSEDGKLIATGTDYSLRIWKLGLLNYSIIDEHKIVKIDIYISFSYKNKKHFVLKNFIHTENSYLNVLDSTNHKTVSVLSFNSKIWKCSFSDDADYFAAIIDEKVQVWNLSNLIKEYDFDISELLDKYTQDTLNISFINDNCLVLEYKDAKLKEWQLNETETYAKNKDYFNCKYTFSNYKIICPNILGCNFKNAVLNDEYLMLLLHYNGAEIPTKYLYNVDNLHDKYSLKVKHRKIPIKEIVDAVEKYNGCNYKQNEKLLLRRFMIACLNLGFFEQEDLFNIVNKFGIRINQISYDYNGMNGLDSYVIKDSTLFINGDLMNNDVKKYEVTFFKAVSQAIFKCNDNNIAFCNAITEMTAEKIYNMDVNKSRIIMPRTDHEVICGEKIDIRTGYENYNLLISLVKQLLIVKGFNENIIIRDMFSDGYSSALESITESNGLEYYLDMLDEEYSKYINRIVHGIEDETEKELIDHYQLSLNKLFKEANSDYFAFCAFMTQDELKIEAMSKLDQRIKPINKRKYLIFRPSETEEGGSDGVSESLINDNE